MTATWTKLADGSWGIRIAKPVGVLLPGDEVTVVKKDGTTSTVEVADITWKNGEIFCRIGGKAGSGSAAAKTSGRGTGRCECGKAIKKAFECCWDCKTSLDEDNGIYR